MQTVYVAQNGTRVHPMTTPELAVFSSEDLASRWCTLRGGEWFWYGDGASFVDSQDTLDELETEYRDMDEVLESVRV